MSVFGQPVPMEKSALDDAVKAFWNRTCDKTARENQHISAEQYGYSLPLHPWLSMAHATNYIKNSAI